MSDTHGGETQPAEYTGQISGGERQRPKAILLPWGRTTNAQGQLAAKSDPWGQNPNFLGHQSKFWGSPNAQGHTG